MVSISASRLLAALRCWRRWRREQAQLLAMSDRQLRDIGLSRSEARAAARQPALWPCLEEKSGLGWRRPFGQRR